MGVKRLYFVIIALVLFFLLDLSFCSAVRFYDYGFYRERNLRGFDKYANTVTINHNMNHRFYQPSFHRYGFGNNINERKYNPITNNVQFNYARGFDRQITRGVRYSGMIYPHKYNDVWHRKSNFRWSG